MIRAAVVALAAILIASPAAAGDRVKILTALPITFALSSALAEGADIDVKAVQPEKLPATRLNSYLAGRGANGLSDAVKDADAVITVRSFWPDDPLYPHARRSNIRIVEIDAGRPLDGALPGIAIAEPSSPDDLYKEIALQPMLTTGEGSAPWLAPTSLGRMADVLAADLARLSPSSKARLDQNLVALKRRLVALKADADRALAAAPSVTVVALSPRFSYLAGDLGLDLLSAITAAQNEWTAERAAKLGAWLRENGVLFVLMDAAPNADLAVAIAGSGAEAVVLSSVEGGNRDPVVVVEANVKALAAALAKGR
jgi:hypothetical protein